jgi:hypothetical protein
MSIKREREEESGVKLDEVYEDLEKNENYGRRLSVEEVKAFEELVEEWWSSPMLMREGIDAKIDFMERKVNGNKYLKALIYCLKEEDVGSFKDTFFWNEVVRKITVRIQEEGFTFDDDDEDEDEEEDDK